MLPYAIGCGLRVVRGQDPLQGALLPSPGGHLVRLAVLPRAWPASAAGIVFLAIPFTWNWRRLARAQLLPACCSHFWPAPGAVPWHHAMLIVTVPVWNELYGDNHWRRWCSVATVIADHSSIHPQLGYGVFPWIALAPSALAGW